MNLFDGGYPMPNDHEAPPECCDLGDECPECGEHLVDNLTWIDDTTVRCKTCGTEYEPYIPAPFAPKTLYPVTDSMVQEAS